MYKLCPNFMGSPAQCIIRTTDGALIPMDSGNTDYKEYLKWVAEGNTPEPADE